MKNVIADLKITAAEERMKKADRFRLRGDEYLKAGKLPQAEDCYKKAERNMKFATAELQSAASWSPREFSVAATGKRH